jgi:hypothetical protein
MSFNILDKDIENCLLEDNKTILTTVTNYGYLLYTLNMLKSLKQFDLDKKVFIVCIDKKSFNYLQKQGYNVFCIDDKELGKFCPWNTKGYDRICYLKLELIYKILSLNKNILLIDGDIVFTKNPLPDIKNWCDNNDYNVWIQNDSLENNNTNNLCTGYLYIKTNKQIIKLYDCISDKGKEQYLECAFDNNDQSYFNKFVKPFIKFKSLDLKVYPNGKMFYNNFEKIQDITILVHFNWIKGHLKMAKMKEHKLWLLTPEEEEFY